MAKKIFINDYVAQHQNEKETELLPDSTIRFEIDNTHLFISFSEDGIRIHKQNNTKEGGAIIILPEVSNSIIIK